MSNQTNEDKQNMVSATVSALALAFLERTLKSGKSVTIPSLGVVIEGDKPTGEPSQPARR